MVLFYSNLHNFRQADPTIAPILSGPTRDSDLRSGFASASIRVPSGCRGCPEQASCGRSALLLHGRDPHRFILLKSGKRVGDLGCRCRAIFGIFRRSPARQHGWRTNHFQLATETKPNTGQDKSIGSQPAGDRVSVTQYESTPSLPVLTFRLNVSQQQQ